MRNTRLWHIVFSLLGLCLVFLLVACGQSTASATGNSSGHGNSNSSSGTTQSTAGTSSKQISSGSNSTTTQSMPATLTSCPAAGTARQAVMAPLALGNHSNLVYIVNQGTSFAPTVGILKRYDIVTGAKTEIVRLPNTSISEAQISSDGQWILFVSLANGQSKLQLVRMDGKGLQTLFCGAGTPGNSIFGSQWSNNEKLIVFAQGGQPTSSISMIDITTGSLEVLLQAHQTIGFEPRTWLDNTHVYLVNLPTDGPPDTLYLLDTSRGANQNYQNLPTVFSAMAQNVTFCWNFDSSYDATKLFVSECNAIANPNGPGSIGQKGPSSIRAYTTDGSSSSNPFITSTDQAITNVRVVTNSTILYQINTTTNGRNSDQNGLWKTDINGSNGLQLNHINGNLNLFSQYPWSNVSRDGKLYAMQIYTGPSNRYQLLFGSMNGGTPTTFTDISDGTQLQTVGWTTM